MRVGIVGAGISGLAAAWTLRGAGHDSVLFEASADVGGRCETIKLGDYIFDSGATSVAPRGRSIEFAMFRQLPTDDLVQIEKPVYVLTGMRVSIGDGAKNAIARYTYRTGNQTLPIMLSEGMDVRRESKIESIGKANGGFEVLGEQFDAVIVTPPAMEAQRLLASVGDKRTMDRITYRSCLSVLLGFRLPLPAVHYHALIEPEQRHPLTWLSLESVKSPGRAPEGCSALVAQLSPQFSAEHFEKADATIVDATLDAIERLYGKDWTQPEVAHVRRWVRSQPENVAMFDYLNPIGSRLLIAGDGLLGGRIEYAFETGVRAAERLVESA